MSGGSFYGVTLTGENNNANWNTISSDDDLPRGLIIKQILLGADAKEGEFNVVEVCTDTIRIPIAVLKAGETRALNPGVEFFGTSVSFQLIRGNGPVYIHGKSIKDEVNDEIDDEDGEEEEETDEHPKMKKKCQR